MTRQQKREADRDFHSAARLIRRCDIARYSGSTTCLTVRKFQCYFYGNWRCKVAIQHSESSTAAHLCVNFNATGCSGIRCGDAQISARFLFGDIIRVCAATKVTISFGDTADAAAKPQDRLRFSFGGAKAQCSAAMRSRDKRDVYLRYDTL